MSVSRRIIPPHENAHILFIGRSDVFCLCIGTSGLISISVN
nr:MAG TPA: hypothetical protein [Caudoviricetes sp.]